MSAPLTYSAFYYGHTVTDLNRSIDFSEGAGELQATLNIGAYTLTDYLAEIKRAIESVGALDYTVTVNRATRVITIAASGTFSLLTSSGTRQGSSAYPMMGFSGADKTGMASYSAQGASGFAFYPQYYLQDYIDAENDQSAVDAAVHESASGRLEVVKFGNRKIMQCNVRWQTDDNPTPHPDIKTQTNAVTNLREFLIYATTKAPMEFMVDEGVPNSFISVILESTPASNQGVGFKLVEKYSEGLPRIFDSGILRFRKIE